MAKRYPGCITMNMVFLLIAALPPTAALGEEAQRELPHETVKEVHRLLAEEYATGSLDTARGAVDDALALVRPAERNPDEYDGTVPFVIQRLYLCKYLIEIAENNADGAYEVYVRVKYWSLEGHKRNQKISELAAHLRGLGVDEVLAQALKANASLNGGKGPQFAQEAGLYANALSSGLVRVLP